MINYKLYNCPSLLWIVPSYRIINQHYTPNIYFPWDFHTAIIIITPAYKSLKSIQMNFWVAFILAVLPLLNNQWRIGGKNPIFNSERRDTRSGVGNAVLLGYKLVGCVHPDNIWFLLDYCLLCATCWKSNQHRPRSVQITRPFSVMHASFCILISASSFEPGFGCKDASGTGINSLFICSLFIWWGLNDRPFSMFHGAKRLEIQC